MVSLQGDLSLVEKFTSRAQQARVVTEAWVAKNGYCLACEGDRLIQTQANTQARDFECAACAQPYELKSSASAFGRRVPDGAYSAMLSRIENGTVANLLLLRYGPEWQIESLTAIHRLLITEPAIQQRKPLSPRARRAGWVGCNISLDHVPPEGRIAIVEAGSWLDKKTSRHHFSLNDHLASVKPKSRGWTAAVLSGLHNLQLDRFTLQDAYKLESRLGHLYPRNRNVKPKIRQQLQVLRDAHLLEFEGNGRYRLMYAARTREQ